MNKPASITALLLTIATCGAFVPGFTSFGGGVHGKTRSSTSSLSMSTLDEYRGSKNWEGLIPSAKAPRVWDEGFQSFLVKYGMLTHIVYDVYIKGDEDYENEEGLRGTSRFADDFDAFTKEGLQFNYVSRGGERKTEYDFTDEYKVIGNIISSPRSLGTSEDNWFGFVALSKDTKELLIVFRGTQTKKEWEENATGLLTPLKGEKKSFGLWLLSNRQTLMCHTGFQQLWEQESVQGLESPQKTIRRLCEEHKGTIEKVTVTGHSLGAAMAQLCAIHLVRNKVLGDVPVLAIAWASPKIGNECLANWVAEQESLRILRLRVPVDIVSNTPPEWVLGFATGGYEHAGTELTLDNTDLQKAGLVKSGGNGGQHHNLQQYIYNIDQTRDIALMNKVYRPSRLRRGQWPCRSIFAEYRTRTCPSLFLCAKYAMDVSESGLGIQKSSTDVPFGVYRESNFVRAGALLKAPVQ